MSDADDLAAFLATRYEEAEAAARDLLRTAQDARLAVKAPRLLGREIPGWHAWPDVEAMCDSRVADIALKRAILAEHARLNDSIWCRTCDPAGHSGDSAAWYPCRTARQLGTEFDGHPGYKAEEWAPDGA